MKSSGPDRLASLRLHAAIASLPALGFAALTAVVGTPGLQAQTTINSGANAFSTETSLDLGALTRNAGGTALFSGAGTINATGTLTNGILGPWAIMQRSGTSANNSTAGYTFATITGGVVTPYTGATALTGSGAWGGVPSGGTGTINYDVSGTMAVTGLARNFNTLRYTGTGATQVGNVNTASTGSADLVTMNGFMNAGSGEFFIGGTGGSNNFGINITIGSTNELVLAPMTAGITVRNTIKNNGANASAVTVVGNNTVSLLGVSAYTGATNVNGGTLLVGGAGNINTTSGIAVNGAGAKYLHTSSVASTRAITLVQGTVDGVGTLGTLNVADSAGAILANGNGATGTLNIGALTFSGDATVNARILAGATPINVTGSLATTPASGTITLNLAAPGGWSTGLNNIIGFGSFSGNLSDFTLGSLTGTNARQSAGGLSFNGNNIAIQINGDAPKWTGAQNGAWTTDTVGGASNWRLITAGTDTDYLAADTVLFDDTASGTTAVQITTANVAPASTTFDHSAKNYTLSSAGGFGISNGSLVKSGSGTLTVTTTNTYTGATTINAGVLRIGDGTTDGSISSSGSIANNGSLVYNNLGAQSYGNVISGSGSLTKQGPGTLTLSGANTYTGGTNVAGGKLVATANGLNGGAIDIAAGSTLTFTGNNQISTSTVTGAGAILNDTANTIIFTGDHSGFTGSFTHASATNNSQFNSAASGSAAASYTLTAGELIFAANGDYTVKMGSLSSSGGNIRGGNSATGTTTLEVGALGTNTSVAGNINNGGTKIIALRKVGAGSLTIEGTNSFGGGTQVNDGALIVNGTLGNAANTVTVASGATLGGSGVIAGATTINGTLAAGNSAGVLAFSGALTLNAGSISEFEIDGVARGTEHDGVDVGGSLTYDGSLTLDFGAPITAGTYDLFGGAFTQSGAFDSVSLVGTFAELLLGPASFDGSGWSASSANWHYDFNYTSGDLTISAVPEPSAFAALAGLAGLGLAASRRRRRA